MAVTRIKDKVSRLGVTPSNRRTVAVLHRGPAAMPNDVLSACGIVEHPIDESTAIHPVGAVAPRGGAACRRDLPQLAPPDVPANYERFIAIGNPPLLSRCYRDSQGGFSPASHRACDFHRTRRTISADYLLRVCEVTSLFLKPLIFFCASLSNSPIS